MNIRKMRILLVVIASFLIVGCGDEKPQSDSFSTDRFSLDDKPPEPIQLPYKSVTEKAGEEAANKRLEWLSHAASLAARNFQCKEDSVGRSLIDRVQKDSLLAYVEWRMVGRELSFTTTDERYAQQIARNYNAGLAFSTEAGACDAARKDGYFLLATDGVDIGGAVDGRGLFCKPRYGVPSFKKNNGVLSLTYEEATLEQSIDNNQHFKTTEYALPVAEFLQKNSNYFMFIMTDIVNPSRENDFLYFRLTPSLAWVSGSVLREDHAYTFTLRAPPGASLSAMANPSSFGLGPTSIAVNRTTLNATSTSDIADMKCELREASKLREWVKQKRQEMLDKRLF